MSYEVIVDLSDVERRSYEFQDLFAETITCKERIVRCRDCRYTVTGLSGELVCAVHDNARFLAEPDGFCNYGTRRNGA